MVAVMVVVPPRLPAAHDLVRLIRPTRQETAQALREFFELSKPPPWSYTVARRLAGTAFERAAPLSAIKRAVEVRCRSKGVASNLEVVELVWNEGEGRSVQCYDPPKGRPYRVRNDLQVPGRANFYYVERRRATLVFVQPRRGYNPSDFALGLLGVLLRKTVAIDDFEGTAIEIFDYCVLAGKTRSPRVLGLADLPQISEQQFHDAMQLLADAFDDVMAMDIDWEGIARKRSEREAEWKRKQAERRNRGQDDFFGPG
jgi:hypothetical protein